MTKLIVQIPCLNEENTLAKTIADIPREIEGVSAVEVLVIDDGSSDATAQIAEDAGADHIIRNETNRGLARSFQIGIDYALSRGADIIVNTDGDNQYCGADIPKLVVPILAGSADIVVGDRGASELAHFSKTKKRLQRLGSRLVSRLAGTDIADAVSGFRAFSRRAALGMTVRSSFSYTTETLIQAGRKRLSIASVPIGVNRVERPSRLFRSIPEFLLRTGRTMMRAYAMYEPLKIFLAAGVVLMLAGAAPILRFLIDYLSGGGDGMVQSLVIGGALFLMGGVCVMFALIADLIAFNRLLLEETLERVRRLEYRMQVERKASPRAFPTEQLREELASLRRRLRR